jgi:hypothetical protein
MTTGKGWFVIDLGGADLSDVTHRFGFSVNGESR